MYTPSQHAHLRKEWHHVEYSQPLLAKPSPMQSESSQHHTIDLLSHKNTANAQQSASQSHESLHLHPIDPSQIRPSLMHLQRSFHHLNAQLRELADFLLKLQRMKLSYETNIEEYETMRKTLEKRRRNAKNSLANFIDLMRKCKEQNWSSKNRTASRELDKIMRDFDEGQKRMQQLLAESVSREKEIVNRRLDALNRQQERMLASSSTGAQGDSAEGEQFDEEDGQDDPLLQKQKQMEIAVYDLAAIDAERQIAEEKVGDLRLVEQEVDELLNCYMDLKQNLLDQQEGIDQIQENFQQANSQAEKGISHVKAANEHQKQGNSIIYGTICLMLVVFLICSMILFALFYF